MSDVLLIKPKSDYDLQCTPPLGLGFLSSYLKTQDHSATILDCNVRRVAPDQLSSVIDLGRFPIVGIQCFDMDLPVVNEYASAIKRSHPETKVVIGGPSPSQNPDYVFRFVKSADFLVVGEGEVALSKLMGALEAGPTPERLEAVPNLAWRNGNGVHLTSHEYIDDLNVVGSPDWESLNPSLYKNAVHGFFYRRLPILPILVSRGCPFRCSFCGSRKVTGFKVRRRSVEAVVDELAFLKEKYGLREFQIIDDNFTAPASAAKHFAEALRQRDLDLLWTCPNGLRVDTLNRELLEAMKAAGCYEVAVGIESGDPDILRSMGKSLSPEKIAEKVNLIASLGIHVTGFVMVGYPGETGETLRRTMDFVLSLPLVRISLTRFVPMPGTPITEQLIAAGELREEDLDPARLNYGAFSYVPRGMTDGELRRLYRAFFLKFLLRARVLWHNLSCVRSISHAGIIGKKLVWFLK